jgi:hypothetical protein
VVIDNKSKLNSIKRHLFFEFMNAAGRAYVLVKHSENVALGKRGFTAEERDKGIILVFNPRMNALWDEHGITATLVFGSAPQKCFIPSDDVVAVYSPELNAQFVVTPRPAQVHQPGQVGMSPGDAELHKKPPKRPPAVGASVDEGLTETGGAPLPAALNHPMPRSAGSVIKVDFAKRKKEKSES